MHIYKFTHTESNRCYIGQTIQDPNHRRLEHIAGSRTSERTYHFHNALRKYGVNAFTFEVLVEATSLEELNRLEELYVEQYNSIDNGFNIRQPGDNKTHHPESILRMSEAQKQAHARRRAEGREGGWERKDGGPMLGKSHPKRGKETTKWKNKGTMSWKLVDGIRVWYNKEATV